jgi:hypothetical protein
LAGGVEALVSPQALRAVATAGSATAAAAPFLRKARRLDGLVYGAESDTVSSEQCETVAIRYLPV